MDIILNTAGPYAILLFVSLWLLTKDGVPPL
jgi:hypothetical protein